MAAWSEQVCGSRIHQPSFMAIPPHGDLQAPRKLVSPIKSYYINHRQPQKICKSLSKHWFQININSAVFSILPCPAIIFFFLLLLLLLLFPSFLLFSSPDLWVDSCYSNSCECCVTLLIEFRWRLDNNVSNLFNSNNNNSNSNNNDNNAWRLFSSTSRTQ